MPHDVEWLLEGRIVYMRDYDNCSLEELQAAIEQLHNLFDAGIKPVHVIHDNRDMKSYPISIQSIKSVIKKHPNMGWMMFVSRDKATNFAVSVLGTIFGLQAKQCQDIDEGLAILRRLDPSLPEDIPGIMPRTTIQ